MLYDDLVQYLRDTHNVEAVTFAKAKEQDTRTDTVREVHDQREEPPTQVKPDRKRRRSQGS